MNEVADFLNSLPEKKRKARKPPQDKTWVKRYLDAYEAFFKVQYPAAYAHQGIVKATIPDTRTGNGLTRAIVNYINWIGGNATRISSSGRKVGSTWIPGNTRKGTADVTATYLGRSIKIEVKAGNDVPSDHQLKEQARERAAGGIYEFVHNMHELYTLIDWL